MGEGGLHRWQAEQRSFLKSLEERFGVPFGAEVHVQLRDFRHPFKGQSWTVIKRNRGE